MGQFRAGDSGGGGQAPQCANWGRGSPRAAAGYRRWVGPLSQSAELQRSPHQHGHLALLAGRRSASREPIPDPPELFSERHVWSASSRSPAAPSGQSVSGVDLPSRAQTVVDASVLRSDLDAGPRPSGTSLASPRAPPLLSPCSAGWCTPPRAGSPAAPGWLTAGARVGPWLLSWSWSCWSPLSRDAPAPGTPRQWGTGGGCHVMRSPTQFQELHPAASLPARTHGAMRRTPAHCAEVLCARPSTRAKESMTLPLACQPPA